LLSFHIEEADVKTFMGKLFKDTVFDGFEVRQIIVSSFVRFEVSGELIKTEAEKKGYAAWSEIKPFAFTFIKGKTKPESIKIIFSADTALLEAVHSNAAALFLNMSYENNTLRFTAATSQKEFALNKDLDNKWAEYINDFFTRLGIPVKYE
jgi:hypothetical protein